MASPLAWLAAFRRISVFMRGLLYKNTGFCKAKTRRSCCGRARSSRALERFHALSGASGLFRTLPDCFAPRFGKIGAAGGGRAGAACRRQKAGTRWLRVPAGDVRAAGGLPGGGGGRDQALASPSSSLRPGILPVVKYCSISSSVRPLVSGRKKAAVMK